MAMSPPPEPALEGEWPEYSLEESGCQHGNGPSALSPLEDILLTGKDARSARSDRLISLSHKDLFDGDVSGRRVASTLLFPISHRTCSPRAVGCESLPRPVHEGAIAARKEATMHRPGGFVDIALLGIAALVLGCSESAPRADVRPEAGDAIHDASITTRIKTTYLFNGHLDSCRIQVGTHDGVVTLRGTVPSDIHR